MVSDQDLVSRVLLANDQRAFSLLVQKHQGAIRAFLRRLTAGDHAAADDLAQETFLAAYRKLHSWQGTAQFSTWLHSVAYRKFLERARKEARYQVMAEVPETGQAAANPAESEILAEQLMATLGVEDRACLTLSYSAGLSLDEIAGLMGLPLGSVKSRIHRAKLKLQLWLDDHDHPVQKSHQTSAEEQLHAG